MTTNSVLLLILSVVTAGGLSFFQYLFKAKAFSRLNFLLSFLRFLSLLGVFLLLINPVITTKSLENVKPPLAIVVDNSSSITYLKGVNAIKSCYETLTQNKNLEDKFEIQSYKFDAEFEASKDFTFKGSQSKFETIAKNLKNVNRNKTYPIVLLTDGNQTSGNDYVYSFNHGNKVFPIVIGDTTKVLDLKINQINANKYAFLKNKFPVELFLNYSGTKNVQGELIITQGKNVYAKQSISFGPSKNNHIVNITLPADKVGVNVYTATIRSKEKEKNLFNNTKYFAVDIINQRTNIAIVSSISHPDISALKRAIESNEQRKVSILKPNEVKSVSEFSVLICYQPNPSFKNIFDQSKLAGVNKFIITGMHTDFNFLNSQQTNFEFKMSYQKEDYLASFNSDFNLYATENIGFENFPPLENPFGKITTKEVVPSLLSARIRTIDTQAPLLAYFEEQGKRTAYLFGENSWKWRLKSHAENHSFEKYDIFIDKLVQFLASNDAKKSLIVNHESFYNSGEAIEFSAQYFNKNYEFDEKAHLTIQIQNTQNKQTKNYDLLKSSNSFKVNLDGLHAGNYTFMVKELNSKTSYSGKFEILNFNIEKQFVNADFQKLKQLATETDGKVFHPKEVNSLIDQLLQDSDYKTIQKSTVNRAPIIEWYWLLVLIAIFLTAEWMLRKYNGLL